jgi:HD-GYP domain-containing protein (c-di-GMP phosphodiesterase class II)
MESATLALVHTDRPVRNVRVRHVVDLLVPAFGTEFHLFDGETGEMLYYAPTVPFNEEGWQVELVQAVARSNTPQCVADEEVVVLFAVPLPTVNESSWVAVAPFATRSSSEAATLAAAQLLGCDVAQAQQWISRQPAWPVHALERMGREVLRFVREEHRTANLEREVEKVSSSLANSYEEIALLHGISQNFRLSRSDEELGSLALEWLGDCVPTRGTALLYTAVANPGDTAYRARTEPLMLVQGESPLRTTEEILAFVESIDASRSGQPVVINHNRSIYANLLPPGVRQAVISPMLEGERVLGYLLALNHNNDQEFGTVEANLLASVSAMLGVHCSNRDLYRQQDEFLASVVRALTSAIDAKDPYTCGHSDRVARVATRIAQHLGCDTEFLGTIYMAGLLHDIGKIGIDDAVLRKTGRLTEAEFEHIKQHPALGYKILADIKQFSNVLPAVLHHHEQWDGQGYPCQLAGEAIPYMARILSVADAYDAMTSHRPYRPGMPEEKMRKIFREGAGSQWDAEVIAAFFDIYDDILAIVTQEQARLSIDVEQWLV